MLLVSRITFCFFNFKIRMDQRPLKDDFKMQIFYSFNSFMDIVYTSKFKVTIDPIDMHFEWFTWKFIVYFISLSVWPNILSDWTLKNSIVYLYFGGARFLCHLLCDRRLNSTVYIFANGHSTCYHSGNKRRITIVYLYCTANRISILFWSHTLCESSTILIVLFLFLFLIEKSPIFKRNVYNN